jgi:hypothetical protein
MQARAKGSITDEENAKMAAGLEDAKPWFYCLVIAPTEGAPRLLNNSGMALASALREHWPAQVLYF